MPIGFGSWQLAEVPAVRNQAAVRRLQLSAMSVRRLKAARRFADPFDMPTRARIASQLYPHRWMLLSFALVPIVSVAGSLFFVSDIVTIAMVPRMARLLLTISGAGAIGFAWAMIFTPGNERRSDEVPRGVLIRLAVLTAIVAAGIGLALSRYAKAIAA